MTVWLRSEAARVRNTVVWSWQGWAAAWATERTLRQWTLVHLLSMGLAFSLDIGAGHRALIVALGFLLLASELMNTAIEKAVDLLSPAPHPLAKKAKDCGSAAVALTAIAGGAVWLVALLG